MRDKLNATGIANRVMMCRRDDQTLTLVVVEGDDDVKLYGGLLNEARCRIQPAYGKPMVQETMTILLERGANGVVAIVDADFTRLGLGVSAFANSVFTDYHDAECMLINSPALAQVLREFGSGTTTLECVRQRLFELARVLGYFRFASQRESWRLRFDGLDLADVVDPHTMTIEALQVATVLRGHQGGRGRDGVSPPTVEAMMCAVESIKAADHPDLQICNGHDMQALLSLGLRSFWGQNLPSDVVVSRIAAALRLAFHRTYFENTSLLSDLCAWQTENTPFRVLH
ncbi:MAG: DUF4435 domain-containing protein [Deltaproteobacteria bacterium]|nr:DUF4435 domain-containing protein [Deltaproteobacteria bacterium]